MATKPTEMYAFNIDKNDDNRPEVLRVAVKKTAKRWTIVEEGCDEAALGIYGPMRYDRHLRVGDRRLHATREEAWKAMAEEVDSDLQGTEDEVRRLKRVKEEVHKKMELYCESQETD